MTRETPSAVRPWWRAGVLLVVVTMVSAFFAVAEPAGAVGPCDAPANEIVAENCLPGSPASEWDVAGAGDPTLQGFATDISVAQGQTINFKIDTTALNYRIDIYRLGYYGGSGARLVHTIPTSATTETAQPDCLLIDGATDDNLVDCGNWSVSASWSVPASATSGLYVARPRRGDTGGASHIPFVVRDDDGNSDLLFQTSDTTWQAYNSYGGNSLYAGPGHAHKVSYNRPFVTRDSPTEDWLFNAEYPMLRWLERNGYDVSYSSGVDTDRRGGELLEHEAFMSVGHDEYWSADQRANVEAARDAGVNVAFFSGNESYWKTRWEASTAPGGSDHRTLVAYKEGDAQGSEHYSCLGNFACDPDPDTWTGLWRQNAAGHDGGRPENALSGQISWHDSTGTLQVPSTLAGLRFWRNTSIAGLTSGSAALAPDTLGYEWDQEQPAFDATYPDGRIALTQTQADGLTHHVSLYRAPSGALVFGAGTVQWSWGLDANHDRGSAPENADMQQATVNLLSDMGAQPGSLQANLLPGGPLDTNAPTATITNPLEGASVPGGTVVVSGTATDAGGVVAAVEVSTDGGTTWDRATGATSWNYSFNPPPGPVVVRARAVDDAANIGTADTVSLDIGEQSCPCSIFSPAVTGPEQTSDNSAVELGVRFRSDDDGVITGIRYYKNAGNTGTHTGTLWSNAGASLATVTFTGESGSGWQEATFDPPVAIDAGTTYVASYHTTVGRYATSTSFATAVDNPPLHALQDGVDGPNGVYIYGGGGTFPTSTFGSSNYLVDVVFEGEDEVGPAVVDETAADFGAGTVDDGTVVSDIDDGEVILTPTINAEFGGSALPAGWTSTLWAGGPGGSTVGSGVVVVDGALLATDDLYGPGRSIEFDATFGASTFQHVGFAVDFDTALRWAMFSTNNTSNTVFARTRDGSTVSDFALPGTLVGSSHRYRIDWSSTEVVYSVDGVVAHTEPIAITADMRPIASDFSAGGPAVSIDWLRMSPYDPSGTFTSRVLDAGALADWQTLEVTDTTPTDTAIGYEVRTGDTTDPDDGTWSAFTPVVNGGAVPGVTRYAQYRATLSTTDPKSTPVVERVAIGYVAAPPGPTIVGGSGVVVEGDAGTVDLQIPVHLSAPSGATVRVHWTTAPTPGLIPGQDYDSASGNLTFAPGETDKVIHITVHGDELDEPGVLFGAEWLFIVMSSPVNAAFAPGLFGAVAHGFIADDDPPPVIAGGIGVVVEGDTGPVDLQIPVHLSAPSGATVTVHWTTAPTTGLVPNEDYVSASGNLTFAPGETEKVITITVLGDNIDEPGVLFGAEWLFIVMSSPTNAVFGPGIFGAAAHGFIADDD